MALRYLTDVVTLELDREKCNGCGMCTEVCPHAVFVVENMKARIVDRDACMECGACEMNCPVEAISVKSGVGCAAAVIQGAFKGAEPDCDNCCGESSSECSVPGTEEKSEESIKQSCCEVDKSMPSCCESNSEEEE